VSSVSIARSILNIHDDFTLAFLKSNNTVGHVPMTKFPESELVAASCRRVAVR